MQSTKEHTRVPRKAGRNLSNRKEAVSNSVWGKGKAGKSCTSLSCNTNDFLTEEFCNVPVSEMDPLFSDVNYRYLYESAKNYSRLLEKDFTTEYNPENLHELYDDLDKTVSTRHQLSLVDQDGILHFRIDEVCHGQVLFYIPCEILDKTTGQFREILLQFFRILKFVHKLIAQKNSYHCEGLFEELEYQEELIKEGNEEEASEALDELDSDYLQLLKSYHNGDISITLDQINEVPAYTPGELLGITEKYTPADYKEKKLLSVVNRGLRDFLLSEDNIFNYVGMPDFDPESGYTPMGADELIMIIYADDVICGSMIESVNCECENGESTYFCSGQLKLTPNTDTLMSKNDFVEPFLNWVLELCKELYAYTSKKK